MKPSRSYLLPTSLAFAATLAATPAFAQSAGFFTFANLGTGDNDANIGLNASKTYLQAYTLNKTANQTINGVTFTGTGIGTTNPSAAGIFSTSGLGSAFNGGGINPGGAFGTLTNRFVYGSGITPEVFNFTNLTVGKTYVITFYGRSWEAAGGRRQNLSASGASTGTLTGWDQDNGAAGQGSLNVLRYTFQAASTSQTINVAPVVSNTTAHQYGFTVEDVFTGSLPSTYTSGSDWTSATWSAGVPNAAAATAILGLQGSPASLNLDANVIIGNLSVDGTNGWALASSGGNTLTLQTDVGGSAVINNSAGTLAISNNVILNSSLAKLGAGGVTISGSVSGTGGIGVGGGSLTLNGSASYAGTTTISSGTTLNVAANANTTSGSYVISGLVNFGSFSDYGAASAMGLRAESSDTNADTDSATAGIGLHIRGGTIQYTGSTPQSTNRHIRVSTAGATFDASGSNPNATLSFTRSNANVNLFDTGGTRTITLTGSNTGNNTFALILENQGGSATSLTKSGTGTWTYSGIGTYTGETTVKNGILNLTGNRVATTGTIRVGDTPGVTGILNQTGSFTTGSTQVIIGNTLGTGIYNLSAGTLTGSANASRGVIIGTNTNSTGTFNLSGTGVLAMGASNLQVGRSENTGTAETGTNGTYNQTGGTATVGTLGIGGLVPVNNASATGNFSVTGGTFAATAFNALAGGDNSIASLTIGGSAQVTLPAFPTTRGAGATATLTLDGGTLIPAAASAVYLEGLTNAFVTNNGAKIDVPTGRDITVNQVLSDAVSQNGTFTKLGDGSLTLGGANSYSGGTTVSAGTLVASHISAFGSGNVTVGATATLNLNNVAVANTIVNTAGGTVIGTSGSANITQTNGTLSGTLGGTITASGTIAGTPTINGTLKGTATFTGAVTIAGTHAPGNSPGIQTFASGVTYLTGSTLEIELVGDTLAIRGTDFDGVDITGGDLTIQAGAILSVIDLGSFINYTSVEWDSSRNFTIVDSSGGGTTTGDFTLDTSLAGAFASEGSWSLLTSSGLNGDTVLSWTPVPEPSTYAALAGLVALGLAWKRRRRV